MSFRRLCKLNIPIGKSAIPKMSSMMTAQHSVVGKTAVRSVVTIAEAEKMVRKYNEMPNDILLALAISGDHEARQERLIREIMSVDKCSWDTAQPQFHKLVQANRRGLFLATLPYKVGIASALISAFVSLPMIFEINTVLWFNELYVTTDVPEAKDLETPLEVGSFAWNWMEPPLGTISFFLLCMQYARSQMENLGIKPYTAWYKQRRADRLVREFPQYDRHILTSFSVEDSLSPKSVYYKV